MTHINLLYRLQRLRSDEQQVLSTGFGSAQTTGTKASVGAKSRQNRSLGARAAHQVGALVAFILVLSSCASAPPETPYNLGVEAYRKRDYSEAAAQWTKAVANDDTAAMNNLGYLLYNGYGVAKDIDRALKLWRVAAVAGESESQWHLGKAYETGIGVERSLANAYAWYECAIETASINAAGATRNHATEAEILKDARGSLDKMRDGLSASDLETGRVLAAEYIAKYGKPAAEQPRR